MHSRTQLLFVTCYSVHSCHVILQNCDSLTQLLNFLAPGIAERSSAIQKGNAEKLQKLELTGFPSLFIALSFSSFLHYSTSRIEQAWLMVMSWLRGPRPDSLSSVGSPSSHSAHSTSCSASSDRNPSIVAPLLISDVWAYSIYLVRHAKMTGRSRCPLWLQSCLKRNQNRQKLLNHLTGAFCLDTAPAWARRSSSAGRQPTMAQSTAGFIISCA